MRPSVRHALFDQGLAFQRRFGFAPYAWWNADRTDLITKDGSNLVSSWRDVIAGYELQSSGGAQPTWSATGFNGLPVIAFDGTDDFMRRASYDGLPLGAAPCEMWFVVDQKRAAAVTATDYIVSSGGTGNTNTRNIVRAVVSGTNRARLNSSATGTGSAVTQGATDFSGRSVIRATDTGALANIEVGGVAATAVASVPAITNSRVTFGASFASTAAAFGLVSIRHGMWTPPLNTTQATALRSMLSAGV